MSSLRPETDLLLAQTGWLTRLARQLVLDPGLVDDAVQATLVTALESPPRGAGSPPVLRSWLGKVLRGQIAGTRRREANRAYRERSVGVAKAEESAATDALVDRAELSTLLVAEIQALPDADRAVLILSYFEDLGAAQIADQLGLSAGAVRTRLSRARAALRERLDRRFEGERSAWIQALTPLAGLARRTGTPATASASSFLAMGAAAKLAVAAALAGAAVLIASRALDLEPEFTEPDLPRSRNAEEASLAPRPDRERVARVDSTAPETHQAPAETPYQALGADGLFRPRLTGRVTDSDGDPVADALITGAWGSPDDQALPSEEARSDAEGRYTLVLPARALFSPHSVLDGHAKNFFATIPRLVTCTAPGFRKAQTYAPYPADEPSELEESFVLTPTTALAGVRFRVLDPEGRPVQHASVGLYDPATGRLFENRRGRHVWNITEFDGRIHHGWRPDVATLPFAVTETGLIGQGDLLEPRGGSCVDVTIRTKAHVDIAGLLVDGSGEPLPDQLIAWMPSDTRPEAGKFNSTARQLDLSAIERPWAGVTTFGRHIVTDRGGRFRVGQLQPGRYWARLEDFSVHGPFDLGTDIVLRREGRHSIRVRAVDQDGLVVRNAVVTGSRGGTQVSGQAPDRFGYANLLMPEGRWQLQARHGDMVSSPQLVELPQDAATSVDVKIDFSAHAVAVSLQVLDAKGAPCVATLSTDRRSRDAHVSNAAERTTHTGNDGLFELSLQPGTYVVRAYPEDEWLLPVLSSITVDPHRQNEHTLRAQRGGRLNFLWPDSVAGASATRATVSLRPADTRGFWALTSRSGGRYLGGEHPRIESDGDQLSAHSRKTQPGPLLPPGYWDLEVECSGATTEKKTVLVEADRSAQVELLAR